MIKAQQTWAVLKPPEPQPETQDHSSISDFSTRPTFPILENPSPISNFTADNTSRILDATADSIDVDSTSAPVPVKPKRPKPRPAFKGNAADIDRIRQSTSSASVKVAGTSQLETLLPPQTFDDPDFSLDIAERTKTRKRKPTNAPSSRKDPTHNSSSSSGIRSTADRSRNDVVIVLSSDNEQEWAGPSLPERGKSKAPRRSSPVFRIPDIPHAGDSSILPPSDPPSSIAPTTHAPSPLFDRSAMIPESTPPSSPIEMRKPKRRIINDEDGFQDDSTDAEVHKGVSSLTPAKKDGEPSTKKQKKTKERKPREKPKATAEGDGTVVSKASGSKKRQPKAKEKEQEFKSNEFVDDSEDDLLLVPHSSKSAPRASYSDPAPTEYSVQASLDASMRPTMLDPTEMIQVSSSVMPSLASTTMTSAFITEPPSADLTAPPPSPSIRHPSSSDKPKAAKLKKKRPAATDTTLSTATDEERLATSMDLDEPTSITLPEPAANPTQKKKKTDKKDKKGKGKGKTEVFVLIDDTQKQDASLVLDNEEDVGLAEQSASISVAEKPRPKAKKDRKKQGTIISSDEDEPEPEDALSKEGPVETESDKTKGNRSENKVHFNLLLLHCAYH